MSNQAGFFHEMEMEMKVEVEVEMEVQVGIGPDQKLIKETFFR